LRFNNKSICNYARKGEGAFNSKGRWRYTQAIADIVSGRIKYKAERKKPERFDVRRVSPAFQKILRVKKLDVQNIRLI
jgi:hypothetical protein